MERMFSNFEDPFSRGVARPARADTVIAFVLAGLTLVLTRPRLPLCLAVTFFCACSLAAHGTRPSRLLRMLSAPLIISGVLVLLQALSRGEQAVFRLRLLGLTLSFYREGLHTGLLVAGRVLSACLLLAYLSLLVPVQEFLAFLQKMRAPGVFVLISLMVYRFSGLIMEEAARIREAQRVRLGYAGFHRGIRSVSLLGASLFLRVNDRSERVYEAARLREAGTTMPLKSRRKWNLRELWYAALYLSTLLVFVAAGWMVHA